MTRDSFIDVYVDLFTRGEMLKGEYLINNCIPLELEDNDTIKMLKDECNQRMKELRDWNIYGRPNPGTYADIAQIDGFPKFELALKKIKKHGGKKVLDVGCYTGGFIKCLSYKGYECSGVDIHKDLMAKLEEKYDNPVFRYCPADMLLSLFQADSFDVVTAFDVLEHCFDDQMVIHQINSVVKPGGLVIINLPRMTPNYKDEAFEHLRMYSEDKIKELFGNFNNYKLEICQDELSRDTSFITYTK